MLRLLKISRKGSKTYYVPFRGTNDQYRNLVEEYELLGWECK